MSTAIWSTKIGDIYLILKFLIVNMIWLSFNIVYYICLGYDWSLSLQEENGLIKREIVWNRSHKHCSHSGSWSCTMCNFVGKFLTVNVGGKERCTDWYISWQISCFKEAIMVMCQNIWVSCCRQICKWASKQFGTLRSSFACYVYSYRWTRVLGMYYPFFQDSILLFVFLFAVID